ncbi:hypothetical protein TWF281_010651 [Arthrobotrys megalospora]
MTQNSTPPNPKAQDFAYPPSSSPPSKPPTAVWPPPTYPNIYEAPQRPPLYLFGPSKDSTTVNTNDEYNNISNPTYPHQPPTCPKINDKTSSTDGIIDKQPSLSSSPLSSRLSKQEREENDDKAEVYWAKLLETEERNAEIRAMQRGCLLSRICCCCCN